MAASTNKNGNSSSKSSQGSQKPSYPGNEGGSKRSSGSRKKSGRKTGSGRAASRNIPKKNILTALKGSAAGRFLLLVVGIIVVLGLDFLFSLNQFDRFFLILGIELIAAVLIGWIRFVIHGKTDEND